MNTPQLCSPPPPKKTVEFNNFFLEWKLREHVRTAAVHYVIYIIKMWFYAVYRASKGKRMKVKGKQKLFILSHKLSNVFYNCWIVNISMCSLMLAVNDSACVCVCGVYNRTDEHWHSAKRLFGCLCKRSRHVCNLTSSPGVSHDCLCTSSTTMIVLVHLHCERMTQSGGDMEGDFAFGKSLIRSRLFPSWAWWESVKSCRNM